jgi:molybdopterin-containing oxidoreductase family iron-sulfur binding subunit
VRYWRTLAELTDDAGFRRVLEEEFSGGGHAWTDGVSRRRFLQLMGAALALGGIGGCSRQPPEKVVPYVNQPEGLVPGRPLFFATAMPWRGFGRGVLVEQHEGRPTKIEGNPRHPSSLGATDAVMQASVLELYDPDRSQGVLQAGNASSIGQLLDDVRRLAERRVGEGMGERLRVRVLTGTMTSPTLAAQLTELKKVFGQVVWHVHEPLWENAARHGAREAFGADVSPVYDFTQARRVVSLDGDFLLEEAGSVRYAREFAHARRVPFKAFGPTAVRGKVPGDVDPRGPEAMNRLYMVESGVSITGAKADHRLPLRPGEMPALLRELAGLVTAGRAPEGRHAAWVRAVAEDLAAHKGNCLVLAGESQPAAVHAVAHGLNAALGAVGTTVRYIRPPEVHEGLEPRPLVELTDALLQGEVELLLILETNPGFTAPVAFREALREFSRRMQGTGRPAGLAVHLGLYEDETAELCRWHVPVSHYLEAWGDLRAHEGTATIQQPLMMPLYGSLSAVELIARIASAVVEPGRAAAGELLDGVAPGRELLRRYWFRRWGESGDAGTLEMRWRKALHEGVVEGTAAPAVDVAARALEGLLDKLPATVPGDGAVEVCLRPDPHLWDGRYANNGWLLELPRPLTRLTWDNVALMSPRRAQALGIPLDFSPNREAAPCVTLSSRGRSLTLAAWIQPGHPEDTVTIHFGFGRRRGGSLAAGAGVDAFDLRTDEEPWTLSKAMIARAAETWPLACTQTHQVMSGRDMVRSVRAGESGRPTTANGEERKEYPEALDARVPTREGVVHLSLYPEYAYTGYKWGMVVDQTACIGCNACVVACQAENNIPIVGKEQVIRGREMHWLRIDTYYGSEDADSLAAAAHNPDVHFQPMLCQHCEKAPCELVCPVEATSHSSEGINEMTYNRCVGTRYCSNNCPYKVRRFNFLAWNDETKETYKMQRNPDVTVRSRGVMEKCTYCIQRINRARIDAKRAWVSNEARRVRTEMRPVLSDAHVDSLPALSQQTACQQACPTEAIIFGDLNDADTYVAQLNTRDPFRSLNYRILTELNTQPRTSYLVRIRNPNPALEGEKGGAA